MEDGAVGQGCKDTGMQGHRDAGTLGCRHTGGLGMGQQDAGTQRLMQLSQRVCSKVHLPIQLNDPV